MIPLIISPIIILVLSRITSAQDCIVGDCSSQNNGRVANCDDCSSYFVCEDGAVIRSGTCSGSLLFDPANMWCDLEDFVTCATTSASSATSLTSVTSEASATSEVNNCILDCGTLPAGSYSYCDDCSRYVDCPDSTVLTCTIGQLFDSTTSTCTDSGVANCLTTSATSASSATSQSSESSQSSKTSVTSESSQSSATSVPSENSESPTVSSTSATSVTSLTSQTTSDAVFCVSDSCASQPDGYYADCSDCQSYFKCDNELDTKITCSDGLLYNSVTFLCDVEADAICSTTSATSLSSQSSESSELSQTSVTSASSATSKSSESSESSQYSATSEAIFCVTSCSNIPDGTYPDCDDCSAAFDCSGGTVSQARSCASPLVFNPDTLNCDFIANVVCATTTTSSTSLTSLTSQSSETSQTSDQSMTSEAVFCVTECIDVPDGRFAACSDCGSYFDCSDGSGSIASCTTGLSYNADTGFCDLPGNVICQTTSSLSVTSATSLSSQSSESSEPSVSSETTQLSETSVISVSSGTSESSPTSIYTPSCVTSCDNVSDGFYADCDDCSKYYICGTSSRQVDCSPNRYNPLNQICDASSFTCGTTSPQSSTSVTSDSSPSSMSSDSSQSSESSESSESSPSSQTSASSESSQSSEASQTSSFSLTSTKAFCLTGCIGVDGVYADCNDCRSYYICSGGSESYVTCQTPLFFNPDSEQCSFTENCQTTSQTSVTSASSQTSETSMMSATSDTSVTSGTSETSITSETSVTSYFRGCVNSCDGMASGLYADCTSCADYHDCATSLQLRSCEAMLFWEEENMRCGLDSALCATTSGTSVTSNTSEEEGSGEVME